MSRTKHTTLPAALDAELYELVREIPAGSVATYGQLARLLAQRTLLEGEGVRFRPNGAVDLRSFLWRPWAPE